MFLLIEIFIFPFYILGMTITQTVEIPESRRITLEVPPQIPTGKAKVELTVTPETAPHGKAIPSIASMLGIDRGKDTMDEYFARKRADKAKEDSQFERTRQRQ